AIDRFFDFQLGHLGWRTLDFEWECLPVGDFQGVAVMNYADPSPPWTRIIEFRHFHPERSDRYPDNQTVIARETARRAQPNDEPYYPINTPADARCLAQYHARTAELAAHPSAPVYFGGRLGSYRYLNMDQVIGAALEFAETI
ncbi:MAG: UDP-galactopyranose mutase, partial [Bifidobacteriaceae bacterium]|nr:UDP-galactopyranose mutase [Bifidobacteriaceae bacterium]